MESKIITFIFQGFNFQVLGSINMFILDSLHIALQAVLSVMMQYKYVFWETKEW